MLNEKQKCVEIKQKSQIKKTKSHERRIDELVENMKTLAEKMEDQHHQTKLITTQFNKTYQITASIKESYQKEIQETKEKLRTMFKNLNDGEASILRIIRETIKTYFKFRNFRS